MSADPIATEKAALRQRMRAMRLVAEQKLGPDAAMAVTRHGLANMEALGLRGGKTIAGYYPIDTEIDVRPLMSRLAERGLVCALPAIVDRDAPLVFRHWHPTDPVEEGPFETRQPPASAPSVVPDVVLVPLLGFDDAGHRLGYGSGYYDRTLARLRAEGGVVAVGVGFTTLARDRVPHADHDQRLDWVLTDAGLRAVGR